MGRLTVALLVLVASGWVTPALAVDTTSLSEQDCRAIADGTLSLKTVPAELAERCQEILALPAPAAFWPKPR